jgi:hypothetical protein
VGLCPCHRFLQPEQRSQLPPCFAPVHISPNKASVSAGAVTPRDSDLSPTSSETLTQAENSEAQGLEILP